MLDQLSSRRSSRIVEKGAVLLGPGPSRPCERAVHPHHLAALTSCRQPGGRSQSLRHCVQSQGPNFRGRVSVGGKQQIRMSAVDRLES